MEYEVSLSSAKSFLKHIDKDKYIPYIFYISKERTTTFFKPKSNNKIEIPSKNDLKDLFEELPKLKNMYMNILSVHGEFGEDGTLQNILEYFHLPFTGSNSKSSTLCMNKYRTGELVARSLSNETVMVPHTKIFKLKELFNSYKLTKDICIKPNSKGSSIGVYLIKTNDALKKAFKELKKDFSLNAKFIVQPLIDYDIEVSCGCLEKKDDDFIELPPIEIIPKNSDFFNYKAKYSKGESKEITPPKHISLKLSKQISKLAIDIHKLLHCNLYSRSDFLIKGNIIYYLETNTLPGMTATSLVPQEANAIGINFTQLIDFLIENS